MQGAGFDPHEDEDVACEREGDEDQRREPPRARPARGTSLIRNRSLQGYLAHKKPVWPATPSSTQHHLLDTRKVTEDEDVACEREGVEDQRREAPRARPATIPDSLSVYQPIRPATPSSTGLAG